MDEVQMTVSGVEPGRVKSNGFAAAMLAIWLGGAPVNSDLKQDMLGFR